MNFFKRESLTEHTADIEQVALVSSRIYILLFLLCVLGLGFFNGFDPIVSTETVVSPSQATFEKLYATYPSTLSCPCPNVAEFYGNLVSVEYRMHQVSRGLSKLSKK